MLQQDISLLQGLGEAAGISQYLHRSAAAGERARERAMIPMSASAALCILSGLGDVLSDDQLVFYISYNW